MTEQAENQDAKTVAFFDFDGTLTTGDTLMPFLKFVVGAPKYYAKLTLVSPVLMAYFAKLIQNDVAKQIVLKQYLAGYHIDELFELGQQFSEEVIPTMLRPVGIERLRWHQERGHECVLVSASLDLYLDYWARGQQLSRSICSSLSVDNKMCVSGKLSGNNCYGDEKLLRIRDYLVGRSVAVTYGYGDTSGDLPMLKALDNKFLLNNLGKFSEI